MATSGYTGKILRVNLTQRQISSIETSNYEAYGGGYGIATAIFWDLCVAPGGWDLQDPFDKRNIVSLMTSPLTGSAVPFGGRTSVSGLAPQSWPVSWFSRSNFGGSFAIMLKLAGWDGVVIEGKSDVPVYINIVDDKVTLEDAKPLWGLSTWETQEEIWRMQSANTPVRYGSEWQKLGNGYTTLRPAIVAIGPAGENKARIGSLVHGAGSGAGQGGFGGVLGSKNLKAVAVTGTGSVKVADPKALWEAREWYAAKWPLSGQGSRLTTGVSACMGCNKACRTRNTAFGNESNCMDTVWYNIQSPPFKRTSRSTGSRAATSFRNTASMPSTAALADRCISKHPGIRYSRPFRLRPGRVGISEECMTWASSDPAKRSTRTLWSWINMRRSNSPNHTRMQYPSESASAICWLRVSPVSLRRSAESAT